MLHHSSALFHVMVMTLYCCIGGCAAAAEHIDSII